MRHFNFNTQLWLLLHGENIRVIRIPDRNLHRAELKRESCLSVGNLILLLPLILSYWFRFKHRRHHLLILQTSRGFTAGILLDVSRTHKLNLIMESVSLIEFWWKSGRGYRNQRVGRFIHLDSNSIAIPSQSRRNQIILKSFRCIEKEKSCLKFRTVILTPRFRRGESVSLSDICVDNHPDSWKYPSDPIRMMIIRT